MKVGIVVLTLITLSYLGNSYKILENCPDLPKGCYCSKYGYYSYSGSPGVYISCKITNNLPLCDVLETLKEHDNALKNSCLKCRNKRSLSIQKLSLDFCPSLDLNHYRISGKWTADVDDETIDSFPKLKIRVLEMKGCSKMSINDNIFESLSDTLTSLTVQNLQLNRVPKSVENLTHLTTLNLDRNNVLLQTMSGYFEGLFDDLVPPVETEEQMDPESEENADPTSDYEQDYETPSGIKKRKSYSTEFKLSVVAAAKPPGSIHSAANKFKIDRKCVRGWLQKENKLRRQKDSSTTGKLKKKLPGSGRKLSFPHLDDALVNWIRSRRSQKLKISRRLIKLEAERMYNAEQDGNNFRASSGWLEKFLNRHNFSLRVRTTACQKPPSDYAQKVVNFVMFLGRIRTENSYHQILACDETPIFLDAIGGKCVEERGAKQCPDVVWNKPFKAKIQQLYDLWMLNGDRREWTAGGNPKAPAMEVYLEWIYEGWNAVTSEMVKNSFKVCGVTSAQDGSEDDAIHCLKPDGANPEGRKMLAEARAGMNIVPEEPINGQEINNTAEDEEYDSDRSVDLITKVEFLGKLSNLQSLSLSRNKINEIDEKVFEPLKNLTYLKVAHNRLKILPSLRFLSALETLYVYDNQIEKLNSLMGLVNLKEVRLDSNKIAELPPYMFTANPLLNEINLSHNRITEIDDIAFGLLPNVTKLSLSYNQLSKVGDIFRNIPKITTIGLMANNFTTFKDSNFANLKSKVGVDLDGNNLTHISPEDFDGSIISTLDLRNNHYLDLQNSMSFFNTTEIEEIYLSDAALMKTCKLEEKFYIPVYSKSTFTNTSEPISSFSGNCYSNWGTPRAYPRSEPPPKPVTTTPATTTNATTTITKTSTTLMLTTK